MPHLGFGALHEYCGAIHHMEFELINHAVQAGSINI